MDQAIIKKIRKGEVRPLLLERSGTNVFSVSGWNVFIVDGTLDQMSANALLQRLDVLERDDKGKFKGVMITISTSASATHEARQLLRDAGAKVIDEEAEVDVRSEPHIGHHG
jgi:hypothetical protein